MENDKMLGLVIEIDTDDFKRSRAFACIYCGDTTSKTRDHIISVSWSGHKRNYAKGDTVPACKECNLLLSDIPLQCISRRAAYIAEHLEIKYRKILNHPLWSDEELEEMSRRFKFFIKSSNDLKKYIQARISHAVLTSLEIYEPVRVKQSTIQDVEVYRILNRCYWGETYCDIEKDLGLKDGQISLFLKQKRYSALIISFKFEKNIPFDYSLTKFFKLTRKQRDLSS